MLIAGAHGHGGQAHDVHASILRVQPFQHRRLQAFTDDEIGAQR